jgi:glycosyltransferase involved in cell wall biosynthesis
VLHSLPVGGAELLAARLARRLAGGYRSRFVCLDELGDLANGLRDEGFPVAVVGRRAGLDWRCPLRLARMLRDEPVDLVHAHQYTPFFYSAIAARLAGRPPVLFTEHGRHHPDHPRPRRMLANRLLLGKRDRVVAVGEAVRHALIHNEGIPPNRVGVIYNGIDPSPYGDAAVDRAQVRREMGLRPEDFVILKVARLDPVKDHLTAVRTLELVAASLPNARLVIVGEGPERPAIEELVRRRSLTGCVRLLGLRRDIPRVLAAADVFLLTSVSEGVPLTLIEAMAAGVPVVATRVGGVGEVVQDGVTGLLAPAGSHGELCAALLRLAGDSDLRRRMAHHGRERATLFSEDRMLAGYAQLYRDMLET